MIKNLKNKLLNVKIKDFIRTNTNLLFLISSFLLFHVAISIKDLGKISLAYILKYSLGSLSYLHIDRAIREGYLVRLVSTLISIVLIVSLFIFYRKFISKKLRILREFIEGTSIFGVRGYAIFVALVFILISLRTDLGNMSQTGSIDLRNRIVGARSALAGYNPYFFKWAPDMPIELLDSHDYMLRGNRAENRLTITPTNIILYMPFSNQQYSQIRISWFYIQYLTYWLGSLVLISFLFKTSDKKIAILFISSVISLSFAWRVHMDRGQIYSLFSLINCLFIVSALGAKTHKSYVISGILLALLISLRPTFVIFLIPLFAFKELKILKYTLISGFVLFLLTTLILGKDIWAQYIKGMNSRDYSISYVKTKNLEDLNIIEVEGVANIDKMTSIKIGDSSVKFLLQHFFHLNIEPEIYSRDTILIIILFSLLLIYLRYKRIELPLVNILIISSGLQTLIDMMIPVPRYTYVDVMIIPVLALIIYDSQDIKNFLIQRFGWVPLFGVLLSTSLISVDSFTSPMYSIYIAHALIYSYIVFYSIVLVMGLVDKSLKKSLLNTSQ